MKVKIFPVVELFFIFVVIFYYLDLRSLVFLVELQLVVDDGWQNIQSGILKPTV